MPVYVDVQLVPVGVRKAVHGVADIRVTRQTSANCAIDADDAQCGKLLSSPCVRAGPPSTKEAAPCFYHAMYIVHTPRSALSPHFLSSGPQHGRRRGLR